MPEEETLESQEAKQPSGPMITKKGWAVVVSVVFLQACLFGVVLWFWNADVGIEAPKEGKTYTLDDANFLNRYKLSYDNLNFTIMTPGASNLITLSLKMDIILGLTQGEKDNPAIHPSELEMGAFHKAVQGLDPDIRDKLQNIIDSMTLQEIQKPVGKERIKRELRDYINDRLDGLDFKEAVQKDRDKRRIIDANDIKITQFILS
ncbi:MAG: flagellar basal body-associated FliL family protein [Planctomycetota bacterium]